MVKEARILCKEYANYLRENIRIPSDWLEEHGKFPPTNTSLKNYFTNVIKNSNDAGKVRFVLKHFEIENIKDSSILEEVIFQRAKSIENFFLRNSTPFFQTLNFMGTYFNTEIKTIFDFAKAKNQQIDEGFFDNKPSDEENETSITPEPISNEKITYLKNDGKSDLYTLYFCERDLKVSKARLLISENWTVAELSFFTKAKELITKYTGTVDASNEAAIISVRNSEGFVFSFVLKLNDSLRNNLLVGTYSAIYTGDKIPCAGTVLVKRITSERDFFREIEQEIIFEITGKPIAVHNSSYLTTNKLPFKKLQSSYNEFIGVYELFSINQKELKFNKYILELTFDFRAKLKDVDDNEFSGRVMFKNEGEVLQVKLSFDKCSIDISIKAYFEERKTLFAYFSGINKRNESVGGKLFIAKVEGEQYENVQPEKIEMNNREFKKLSAYYATMVPFFLGKIEKFNDYTFLYQLSLVK